MVEWQDSADTKSRARPCEQDPAMVRHTGRFLSTETPPQKHGGIIILVVVGLGRLSDKLAGRSGAEGVGAGIAKGRKADKHPFPCSLSPHLPPRHHSSPHTPSAPLLSPPPNGPESGRGGGGGGGG